MSYNKVFIHRCGLTIWQDPPSWQPTVHPLTGYTSPLHTPYHSCICYYHTHRNYPRSPRTVAGGEGMRELQCVAISCPANRLTQNTTQDLFQRCRDPDKMIDFLALVTLMGHLDGSSRIYEKPFQSESHYFFQSVLLMSA